ncbi:MAG: hypothetical protein ACOYW4_00670 [Bacillota bacterium]
MRKENLSPEIGCMSKVVIDLVLNNEPRTATMMAGWDLELARQKTLFFTQPATFLCHLNTAVSTLDSAFARGGVETRKRSTSYLLGIADSLNSIVELGYNLQSQELHGPSVLAERDVTKARALCQNMLSRWETVAPDDVRECLREVEAEDLAVNKGDNLFVGWAKDWQANTGNDPYHTVSEFLKCFSALYSPDMYYPALFLAREDGKTATQFFNDYGLQAARCRKIGSLGGTTNPVIAVLGEDDLDGFGNVWGQQAADFIRLFPNKWHEVRRRIAREQVDLGMPDDWAATRFTEWVVADAMLALRSVFLLRGLGRVSFQLRPDWHDDEEKLILAGASTHAALAERVRQFDDVLLDGAGEPYVSLVRARLGKPNNHFKVACTSQVALNVVKAFNAGYHGKYPDALKERLLTNMTLSYDVPQMVASSLAIEEGIQEYERRTGERVDEGQGGSVVTSMIGRFNDSIRSYRINTLFSALPEESPFRSSVANPVSIKTLEDPAINNPEFIALMKQAGIDFEPCIEEDAIDHAGTLLTKRVVVLLRSSYGCKKIRILTASKRKFHQNVDLLGVPFSTDFGNIQRMSIGLAKADQLKIERWETIGDGMNPDGTPAAGSVWEKREAVLRRIWPGWAKAYEASGLMPDEYLKAPYVRATLDQFIAYWAENVSRAKMWRERIS